ncbi:hypothetical protein BO82DRAFT_423697 [Aspergillus uvarum CBS 121591]|uniref:ABM domain-containing protein n=1 Tax=Aspergillus uvarum CBS 121591 TaxID=1448315 RepID=A0A319DC43_9EURO|nr:hypothetical protein BO82DRAFT_423697 [Aspergillus uvarum CBS 121591]PYH77442.1 hypothetical protein BO82DRAFT_423697 [Aspergillus uvarum CBS 121591]
MSFQVADVDKNLIHGALILTPKPEHIDEICSELSKLAKWIEANEPGTLVFSIAQAHSIKEIGGEGPTTIGVTVVFANQAAAEEHRSSPKLQAFIAKGKEENKLTGPPEIRSLTPSGGFLRKPPQ